LFFRVTDLDRAITTIRRLGGTAEPAGEGPEGRHAMCVDNQGVVFGLSEPSEEY
jgi:predicted enzyme related to lactoylglutathione lyase